MGTLGDEYKKEMVAMRLSFGKKIEERLENVLFKMGGELGIKIDKGYGVESGIAVISLYSDFTEFHKYKGDHKLVAPDRKDCVTSIADSIQKEVDAYRKYFDDLEDIVQDMQEFGDAHSFDTYLFHG